LGLIRPAGQFVSMEIHGCPRFPPVNLDLLLARVRIVAPDPLFHGDFE